jgi:PilZ domain
LHVRNYVLACQFGYFGLDMFLSRFRTDRRRWPRERLSTPVQLLTHSARLDGRGIKLSEGGMCVFTLSHLELGSEVQLEFCPPHGEKAVRVSGRVRSRALYLYGIEFQRKADSKAP